MGRSPNYYTVGKGRVANHMKIRISACIEIVRCRHKRGRSNEIKDRIHRFDYIGKGGSFSKQEKHSASIIEISDRRQLATGDGCLRLAIRQLVGPRKSRRDDRRAVSVIRNCG